MRRTILLLAAMALTLLVASGVALAVNEIGTGGPDTLRGTNGADNLLGLGGNDTIFGGAGSDNLLGGAGKDVVIGDKGGDKNLLGGAGNDIVGTNRGSDHALGGEGNDFVVEGLLKESSKDILSGGDGNDVIMANNKPAFGDVVVCGRGFDRVDTDKKDVVAADCEHVVALNDQEFFDSVPQSFFAALP